MKKEERNKINKDILDELNKGCAMGMDAIKDILEKVEDKEEKISGISKLLNKFKKEDEETEEEIENNKLREIYEKEYGGEYFIKLMDEGEIPHLSSVRGSNFVHIGGFEIDETGRLVIISAIDNLVKGASGQAVHNMNIMCGFDEKAGLDFFGMHP